MLTIKKYIGVVLFFVFAIPVSAFAKQEGVSIAVLDLPHLFQKDKQGFYDMLFAEMQKAGLVKSWEIIPPNRSGRMMKAGEVDCKAPLSFNVAKKLGFAEDEIVFTKPFNYTLGHLMAPKEHPVLEDHSLLKDQTVGTVKMGKIYGVPDNMLFHPQSYRSYDILVEAIERGHIDFGYFIAPDLHFSPRGSAYFEEHKDNSFVIWRGTESIACNIEHATIMPKMNQLINRFLLQNKSHPFLTSVLPTRENSEP